MKQSRLAIIILSTAFIGSNIWWAYRTFDNGITLTYMEDSLQHASRGFNQAKAILPLAANNASREQIIEAAKKASQLDTEPFDKEGYVWVGELGLKFDSDGKFVGVAQE